MTNEIAKLRICAKNKNIRIKKNKNKKIKIKKKKRGIEAWLEKETVSNLQTISMKQSKKGVADAMESIVPEWLKADFQFRGLVRHHRIKKLIGDAAKDIV